MIKTSTSTAGIDTGKKTLHLGFWPSGERLKVANGPDGFARLAEALARHDVERVGIESTSIYHEAVTDHLRALGYQVLVLQPGQVKAFRELHNRRLKADTTDAELVAGTAEAQIRVATVRTPQIARLAEHLTFIEQCEDNAARLKTQLERFRDPALIKKVKREIARFRLTVRTELKALEKDLRGDPEQAKRLDLAVSVQGVGKRTALATLIRMPELGTIDREQAAALLGVAPMNDESGEHKGVRFIQGGRARARKSLFMAAFAASLHHNPQLKAFYLRLIKRGKPHTLAVIACTRKLVIMLNAVLARGTPWIEREGMPCPQC